MLFPPHSKMKLWTCVGIRLTIRCSSVSLHPCLASLMYDARIILPFSVATYLYACMNSDPNPIGPDSCIFYEKTDATPGCAHFVIVDGVTKNCSNLWLLMFRISPRVPFARFHVYHRLYFPLNISILRLGFPKRVLFVFIYPPSCLTTFWGATIGLLHW